MASGKGKGRSVTRSDVADLFGVALTTVDGWVRAGCPYEQKGGRGKPWWFNSAEVAAWREEQKVAEATGAAQVDEQELRRRKLAAETLHAELSLAKDQEVVAPIELFEKAWTEQCTVLRSNILNVPGRVVGQIVGETDERLIKTALRDELTQALMASANVDIDLGDEDLDKK